MVQLGELQALIEEFEARDTVVVTIANEEDSLESNLAVRDHLGGEDPRFVSLVDLEDRSGESMERTTAYFVDATGRVRQVFPMEIYARPPWWSILNEIDAILAEG